MSYEALRTQIKAVLKRDTALFTKKLAQPVVGSKISPKAQAVFDCLKNKDFGAYREPLRLMMSLALGEELPSLKESSTLYLDCGFIAVVATSNKFSGHEYHVDGQVAARLPGFSFEYSDQFVKQSGRIGSHMTADLGEVRPATDGEIDSYVDKLTEDTMLYLSKHIVILEALPSSEEKAPEKAAA